MILYTIGCVKCKLLEDRLQKNKIKYEVCNDIDTMTILKIMSVPVLQLDNGELLDYGQAMKFAKDTMEENI